MRPLLALLAAAPLAAQAAPPRVVEVSPGVYLFQTPSYSDVGLDGNAVAVVTDDGVLVFDANGTPAAAANVVAEIRRITAQPVRYLVYSHWHWDHWYGGEVYREAFPDVAIVSHERTRALMAGPAIEFNRPGLETQLPGHIGAVERALADARVATPPRDTLPLQRHLAADRWFLEQKRGVRHTLATRTFTDSLIVRLGGREIRILHHERAVTPGDAFLYLSDVCVVISGDLLVNPVSFALSCYPTGWLRTLERIRALEPTLIVPGHGEPLRDLALLDAHIALFQVLLDHGTAAHERGLDVDAARDSILSAFPNLAQPFTHGDPNLVGQFRLYLVDWYLHRVWDELRGPLTDDIAPIPVHNE
jgi:glyoxylase-like metal-dependent hydrolase (beta-lactamase superfamily II)